MKKNVTELVFVLDRSGSMSGLEQDTIGGFNGMLTKQKETSESVIVTTVLFDDRYEILHDRINIQGVGKLSDEDYFVRGSTALLDAIGKTIQKIANAQKYTLKMERPQNTLFVIITDGEENASRKFSSNQIKKLITKQEEKGWEFIFLGANIDAVATAENIGINRDRAVNYYADEQGIEIAYFCISDAITEMHESESLSMDWRKNADIDFENRSE